MGKEGHFGGSIVLEGKVLSVCVMECLFFCSMHHVREGEISAHVGNPCDPN